MASSHDLSMRSQQQLKFILEIDRLKTVLRQSLLCDASRRENSAEHSWHIAVMAATFAEHAKQPVNLERVVKMLLVHDVIEIDAGDTYAYDDAGNTTREVREQAAADRIFGLLPSDQAAEFRHLWDEFEAQETADSRYAIVLDRLQPLLLNFHSGGKTWMQHGISSDQVLARMRPIQSGAPALWTIVTDIVNEGVRNGWLKPGSPTTAGAADIL